MVRLASARLVNQCSFRHSWWSFPSRFFRHSCIYVNAASGIKELVDLIGRRVGNPEYQMTAPVWIRGILSKHYGVPVDSVTYMTGGEEEPGCEEKLKLDLPDNIRVERVGPIRMLRDGEIDALYTARKPSSFNDGDGKVVRLFPNYVEVEKQYYRETGLFPIMHTVAIRREIYERDRWVAQALFKAFQDSQARTYGDLAETAALKGMLPWFNAHVEDAVSEMGDEFWPYGFDRNRNNLATFLRYHHELGAVPTHSRTRGTVRAGDDGGVQNIAGVRPRIIRRRLPGTLPLRVKSRSFVPGRNVS